MVVRTLHHDNNLQIPLKAILPILKLNIVPYRFIADKIILHLKHQKIDFKVKLVEDQSLLYELVYQKLKRDFRKESQYGNEFIKIFEKIDSSQNVLSYEQDELNDEANQFFEKNAKSAHNMRLEVLESPDDYLRQRVEFE